MSLTERVEQYLRRTKLKFERIPRYPLNEIGIYRLVGGSGLEGGRKEVATFYHGRFIDAISKAIQDQDYFGEWCSNVDNPNNGYLEKVVIEEVPESSKMSTLVRRQQK